MNRKLRQLLAITTVIALCACPTSGQGITEIVALTGGSPPEGNGTFSFFSATALNNTGQTAFLATLTGTSGGTNDDSGIYRGEASAGLLTRTTREKPIFLLSSGISGLEPPAINSSGELDFVGRSCHRPLGR